MTATVILGAVDESVVILIAALCTAVGALAAAGVRFWMDRIKRETLRKEIIATRTTAEAEAQKIIAQAEAQAKSEFIRRREQFDSETERTRQELREEEKRLSKREDIIDQKLETVNSKERLVEAGERAVGEREKALVNKDRQLNELIAQQKNQLLKVANLSMEEARNLLLGLSLIHI